MSDEGRKAGRLKYILIALAIVIGAGILGFYMCYRNLPEIHGRLYVFRTAASFEADVFINSVHVGKTPLTLTFEELKNRFNPDLNPAAWPSECNEHGESSGPGYSRQMYRKDARPEKGINESIFYFNEKEAGVPDVRGAFALRIEGSEGCFAER